MAIEVPTVSTEGIEPIIIFKSAPDRQRYLQIVVEKHVKVISIGDMLAAASSCVYGGQNVFWPDLQTAEGNS